MVIHISQQWQLLAANVLCFNLDTQHRYSTSYSLIYPTAMAKENGNLFRDWRFMTVTPYAIKSPPPPPRWWMGNISIVAVFHFFAKIIDLSSVIKDAWRVLNFLIKPLYEYFCLKDDALGERCRVLLLLLRGWWRGWVVSRSGDNSFYFG